MKLYDLDNIKKTDDDLFDLNEQTYREPFIGINDNYLTYTLQEGDDMRPDKITSLLYGNVDDIDIITSANRIDNPLNIMMDDELSIPPRDIIGELRYVDEPIYAQIPNRRKSKIKSAESTGVDANTPVKNVKRVPGVTIENNKLVIGKGLFD